MNIHVLPATASAINELVDKENPECNTQGKIIDQRFAMDRRKKKRGRQHPVQKRVPRRRTANS
jgi:hypothetical protein